jgi:hypothetical protein
MKLALRTARSLDLSTKLPISAPTHNNIHIHNLNSKPTTVQSTTIDTVEVSSPKNLTSPNPTQPTMSNTLTNNDRKILAAAWHCFESQPKASEHLSRTATNLQPGTTPSLTAQF